MMTEQICALEFDNLIEMSILVHCPIAILDVATLGHLSIVQKFSII